MSRSKVAFFYLHKEVLILVESQSFIDVLQCNCCKFFKKKFTVEHLWWSLFPIKMPAAFNFIKTETPALIFSSSIFVI